MRTSRPGAGRRPVGPGNLLEPAWAGSRRVPAARGARGPGPCWALSSVGRWLAFHATPHPPRKAAFSPSLGVSQLSLPHTSCRWSLWMTNIFALFPESSPHENHHLSRGSTTNYAARTQGDWEAPATVRGLVLPMPALSSAPASGERLLCEKSKNFFYTRYQFTMCWFLQHSEVAQLCTSALFSLLPHGLWGW